MKSSFLSSRYFVFDVLFFSYFFHSFLFFYEVTSLSAVFLLRKDLVKFSIGTRFIFTNQLVFNLFSSISFFSFLKPVSFIVFSEFFNPILDFHFFLMEKSVFFLLAICVKGFFINISLFDSFLLLLDRVNVFKYFLNFYSKFYFFFYNIILF